MLTLGSGCTTMKTSKRPTPGTQASQVMQARVRQELSLRYLLFLPQNYQATSAQKWPLILFLHGAGERGTNLTNVAVHGPPKFVPNQPDFPFIVASPQCPSGEVWSDEALSALLDDLLARYNVDATRVYLTGLSMGGYGTWSLATKMPSRFAAVAPICGGGETIRVLLPGRGQEAALKSLGVWAFHGGKDTVVPLDESERMVAAFKKAGCKDVQLTVYPDAGHDSWSETYKNPKLYEWFLMHQRR
jgi:predicted peptidase